MANELDRVRVSAAELRAEASNSVNISDCPKVEQRERHAHKQQRRREGKRPDLQRYQTVAGSGRHHCDSEEGDTGQCDPLAADSYEQDRPSQREKKGVSERHGCTDGGMAADKREEDRIRGDGSNTQNCRKGSQSQAKTDTNHTEGFVENDKEQQEPAGDAKTKKARKPDREFYQPGSRRNIQGKDCGAGREQEKPPPSKTEPESQLSTGEREGNKKASIQKQGGKDKGGQENVKLSKSSETNRKQESRDVEKHPLPSNASVEKITSKVEKLSMKYQSKVGNEVVEELSRRRGETTDKERMGQGGGKKEEEEKVEKKRERGNRRRRGGEKEKEKNQDFKRGDTAIGGGGKNEWGKAEKERDKRAAAVDRDNKPGKTGETHPSKGRENHRDSRRGDNNNNRSRDAEKDAKTQRNVDSAVERGDRNQPNANITTPTSKRYSKSDIRRSRNRTYSSSSASSVTSLDGPGLGMDVDSTKWSRLDQRHNNKEGVANTGEGRRRHLQSWTTNGESSTESLEGSEISDIVEERRRRRRGGEEELSAERRREERNKPKGNRGGGRGILRVSIEKQSGTSPHSGVAQNRKQGLVPRGRGGGILVLPARTDISNSPEVGQRLLFGGIRGGSSSRSRGGRGGGLRRLWDPNNPDQKPALASTQSTQHSPLQQPVYLQTGAGYGQLHFLDTDDEVTGSPPVPQGEHFRSKQAAAMAYYKFQNSDNPYCYPMPTSNPHNPGTATSQRYPYPYHMGAYQMASPNGMYPGPGVGQFCGSYRGTGYTPQSAGGTVTLEEVEQQARGELGRLLRAADAQELQLSNLLSRDRVSADGLDRMAQLRADLLGVYEQVILTDIELSDSQNVDQALWKNVFYQVIERFRQLLKDPTFDNTPHIRNMLLTLLDEGALFFDALLQKLQTVYQFKLEDYMDGMAIRARPLRKTVKYALISAQRCMICQGDIARYREQASDSANYGKARSWYLKAQQIAPKNGRPYNQLALLAVYTKRKLDAVYYYMRSLAASNPILTAKESLMSLFEEAKRKTEQLERRRRQEHEGGSRGPAVRGRGRGEDGARVEIWIRPSGQAATPSSQRGGSESSRDSEQDGELGSLSASDLNKRFILSFLHAHGKLFTKVGMETFPAVASRVLQEFRTLLQHGPSLLGSTHILQIITINMFTIHNAHSRGEEGEVRSVLQEQSTVLGLGMFALLVQRCTELLRDIPAEPVSMADTEEQGKEEKLEGMVRVSAFPLDLRELLPSIKVWSDWMLGCPDQWNPPPCSIDCSPDVWQCLADLCNVLARVDHGEVPLYKVDTDESEGDEELTVLQLKEDRLLAGFIPLLAAPQEPCYTDRHTDMAIAADCKRVTVLKYFLEALCGQEEPLLAFKGGKYVSVAASPPSNHSVDTGSRQDHLTEKETDDVIVEAESSLSASEGEDGEEAGDSENDIRQLKARRHALANKLAQQQKRRDKIQAVLQTGGQLELEVRPLFLVPDTNGFIDHLGGLRKLLQCGTYIIVVPLIVITELDGLAKGQDNFGGGMGSGGRSTGSRSNYNISATHVRAVQEKARLAVAFLERGFEAREPCLRALTSRGNQLESIAFRSEDTSGQQGNNDDVILSCCLHYCKDKAKDFMPDQRNGTVRLQREVVLLTDDRNLRVKALTRNVPVRDIPAFLSWAKVG
ncbi:Telomerase-binding protein EST1A [Larimichthys crocea]|uniref:Telomerase-binding protein EST1A n=2 Tax=Larimichthys crocea TaxID=215358 RepID=A0A6G0I7D2_LARCR|nr:Telomerase-binding protein EST1A [Larimichthys crocea]TMS14298.1 Telomerase-binding protein EST1A [Larimichthys crocea]